MSNFANLMSTAAKSVSDLLGSLCYYITEEGEIIEATIIVKRNQIVRDDFGMIAGYQCTASILKSELCEVNNQETFTDTETGIEWRVIMITKQTSAKFYVDIIEVGNGRL